MTTTSYPAKGTGGFDISEWSEYFEGDNGIIGDYVGTALDLTRINAGEIARISPGKVRVGGYILEVTANHDLVVSTAAATYYIWACYDPALNVPGGGGTASSAGPCTLNISSGAPSTAGGKIYVLLYQIIRSASQALTAATVVDYRTWTGPTLHVPAVNTIPAALLTDPETPPVGFAYPVGARIVHGSTTEYTHIKSASGLKWESASIFPTQQIFYSGGTWTKPAGARWVHIQVQAGGGGGAGADTTGAGESSCGVGGQGGGYAESLLAASALGPSVTVTVGIGGTASTGGSGNPGGTSSFGAHVSAEGGFGGNSVAAANTAGGVHSGAQVTQTMVGQLQFQGGGSGTAIRLPSGGGGSGGQGGNTFMGSGAAGRGASGAGLPGSNYGGGGGGAANFPSQPAVPGGVGAGGLVIVTTYF